MTTSDVLIALALGVVTGFSSGLMGIGGGIILTPLLRLFLGVPALIALATPLPMLIPTALSSSIAYHQEKHPDYKLSAWMLLAALPMTWIGATLTTVIGGKTLMIVTAIFIMLVALSFLVRSYLLKQGDIQHPKPTEPIPAMSIGAVGGVLAGLLGIGGGIIYIPSILRFFRRTMKVAQATSLVTVTMVAIPGTIKHAMLGHIDWGLAAIIACTSVPASYLGARIAMKLRNHTLEKIFGIVTFIFGIYFLFSEL